MIVRVLNIHSVLGGLITPLLSIPPFPKCAPNKIIEYLDHFIKIADSSVNYSEEDENVLA